MSPVEKHIICVACSIFRQEIEALQQAGQLNANILYLNSMLHIYPEQLRQAMDRVIAAERGKGRRIALIYGECHASLTQCLAPPDIARINGMNCIEIFLGRDRYRELRKQGAFFLLPEWVTRWREIFQGELGLNQENAQTFMQEMHTQLIYLDTGIIPVPHASLQDIAAYTGLPVTIMRIEFTELQHAIQDVLRRVQGEEHVPAVQ